MARAQVAIVALALCALAAVASARRAADMMPFSELDASAMAYRPEPLLATKPYEVSLSGAGRAWDQTLELIPHKPGHAHPSLRANPINSDAGNIALSGDILAKVLGLTKPPGATPKSL